MILLLSQFGFGVTQFSLTAEEPNIFIIKLYNTLLS